MINAILISFFGVLVLWVVVGCARQKKTVTVTDEATKPRLIAKFDNPTQDDIYIRIKVGNEKPLLLDGNAYTVTREQVEALLKEQGFNV